MNTTFIASGTSASLLSAIMPSVPGMPRRGSWTVADENGLDAIEFTSFMGVNITSNADASTLPVELGGFISANKVASPIEASVTLAVQGDSLTFQRILDTLNTFTREAKTLNVVTPEREFPTMTLMGFSYARKTEEGLSMLVVELKLREVCYIPPRYSDTAITEDQAQNPSDVSTVAKGRKRPSYRPDLIGVANWP